MTDELGLFNDRHGDRPSDRHSRHADRYGDRRPERSRTAPRRRPPRRRARRRITVWIGVLVVLVLIAGGVWFGLTQVLGIDIGGYDDYSGSGERDVVVEIPDGATTGVIAGVLHDKGVVASTKAFVKAAESDSRVLGIQPGFYVMRTKVSGKDAITKILAPGSRKGRLEIRGGYQLDDITKLDGGIEPGIVKRLSTASCADLDGKSTCVPVEELRKVAETGDPAALGVPDWAVPDIAKLEPKRRFEGLVQPGVYDVRPGSSATEVWQTVISESTTRLQAIGMPKIAADSGFTPYQVLVMASLIEREGIEKDFAKVSRVIYNRLTIPMKLGFDSTVNYVLNRPAIRTKEADRTKAGAYNTYANFGLPPGPISAPSKGAIEAAVKPVDGNWVYFVRCQKDGTSCFAETLPQHEANVKQAQANGAY